MENLTKFIALTADGTILLWLLVLVVPTLLLLIITRPYFILILFVFIIPFEDSVVKYYGSYYIMTIIGVLLVFVYIIHKVIDKQKTIINYKTPLVWLLFILNFLMFLSATFSADSNKSLNELLTYLQLFIFYVIIVNFIDTKNKYEYLLNFLLIAGLINAIYSIYNYNTFMYHTFSPDVERESGLLMNANRFGYVQGLIILLTIPILINNRNRLIKAAKIIIALLILYSTFLSMSRGVFTAIVAVICYTAIYVLMYKKAIVKIVLIIAIIAMIVPHVMWDRVEQTFSREDVHDYSKDIRLTYTIDGFLMGLANPLTGVGLGRFKDGLLQFSKEYVPRYRSGGAHNMYISLMAENGIPVLVIFLFLIYKILSKIVTYRKINDKEINIYGVALELSMVFSLVAGFFATLEYSKMFWLLLALGSVPENIYNLSENKSRLMQSLKHKVYVKLQTTGNS
jgi:putative inorganic carbon (hco3(-)) transporter